MIAIVITFVYELGETRMGWLVFEMAMKLDVLPLQPIDY